MITHPHITGSSAAKPQDVDRLVRGAAAGDQRCWDSLVRRFSGLISRVARAHGLDHADVADVTQATWIKLLEHVHQLDHPGRVGGWLATTARRECLRVLRAQQRFVPLEDGHPEGEPVDELPCARLMAAERDVALRRGVSRLRQTDQALLRLLTADCCPAYGEISVELKMPIGSIGPTRARALERLRRELQSSGELTLLSA